MARALFCLNAHCGMMFSLLDENDVHLSGYHCPIHLSVKFNEYMGGVN